jgi:hypothetical protein
MDNAEELAAERIGESGRHDRANGIVCAGLEWLSALDAKNPGSFLPGFL